MLQLVSVCCFMLTRGMLASKYYPVISFTAGSVIVRMAINGNEVWGYLIPDREEMLNSLVC